MSDVMHTANRIWVCASCIGKDFFFLLLFLRAIIFPFSSSSVCSLNI